MLTFYPEFECAVQDSYEMIIMVDLSNSMTPDDIITAKKVALVLMNSLNNRASFNLITFGSSEYILTHFLLSTSFMHYLYFSNLKYRARMKIAALCLMLVTFMFVILIVVYTRPERVDLSWAIHQFTNFMVQYVIQ